MAESADELKLSIVGIHVQNLRGFADATLNLSSPTLFLVGPNNSGKTSLLRLLDVFFTWDLEREYSTKVSDDLLDVLLPARETRNAARRLTVTVCVADGRRHRALGCTNGQVDIRLSLTVNDRRLRANLGQPRRNESHDTKAAGLIQDLRNEVEFVHIPAGRSVDSASFGATLSEVMTQSLASTLQQPGKGATRAEREAMKVVDSLEKLAGPLQDFWKQFLDRLPTVKLTPRWIGRCSHGSSLISSPSGWRQAPTTSPVSRPVRWALDFRAFSIWSFGGMRLRRPVALCSWQSRSLKCSSIRRRSATWAECSPMSGWPLAPLSRVTAHSSWRKRGSSRSPWSETMSCISRGGLMATAPRSTAG